MFCVFFVLREWRQIGGGYSPSLCYCTVNSYPTKAIFTWILANVAFSQYVTICDHNRNVYDPDRNLLNGSKSSINLSIKSSHMIFIFHDNSNIYHINHHLRDIYNRNAYDLAWSFRISQGSKVKCKYASRTPKRLPLLMIILTLVIYHHLRDIRNWNEHDINLTIKMGQGQM